jgi:ribonuclease-3
VPSPVTELAVRLGVRFRNPALLEQAVVHSSWVNEHSDTVLDSNERMEFLGDAVIALVISEALWARHPEESEGLLTTRRAAIVSARGLARIAARLDLGRYLVLGQGAERSGERKRGSVLASAFEAVVAAIYLDRGLPVVRDALLRLAEPELEAAPPALSLKSPKSRLQELAYSTTGHPPAYRILSVEGPDHARQYAVEVMIGGETLGRGEGLSRRDAETEAAAAALARLPLPPEVGA